MSDYPKIRARLLRRSETSSEKKAWHVLRQFRSHGFPVRRQHPIDGLIVDFSISRAKLVIELDGGIHNWSEVALKDAERDAKLKAAGWKILRLSNQEALDEDLLFRKVAEVLGI